MASAPNHRVGFEHRRPRDWSQERHLKTGAVRRPRPPLYVAVRLRESFDERRILTLEILKHQPRDIAPVDDPAVQESSRSPPRRNARGNPRDAQGPPRAPARSDRARRRRSQAPRSTPPGRLMDRHAPAVAPSHDERYLRGGAKRPRRNTQSPRVPPEPSKRPSVRPWSVTTKGT